MKRLVLGDVHANRPALNAVLGAEPDWDDVLFLGDAVDYGPHPVDTVDRLSGLSGTFVMGNHDRDMLADPGADPPRGRADFTQWTRSQLSESDREFLRTFEETVVVPTDRGDVRVHHGDFDERFEDIDVSTLRPYDDPATFAAVGDRFEESTLLFGHSHWQYELTVNGTRFVNPGTVGRNNQNAIAAQYVVLLDGEIHLRETDYDAEATVATMEALPVDEEPTIWRRCLKRELFRLRRDLDGMPDEDGIARSSRYEPRQFHEEFGSLEAALEFAGLPAM